MIKLSRTGIRAVSGVVVLAVVAVVAYYALSGGSSKKLTANFASGVGVYPGTPVKILGIQVGSVTKVTPNGGSVKIDMKYDSKYRLPANAAALLVANSLVSDRYVQLAPVYSGSGPVLPSGGTIPKDRTASPAELDDIYGSLNQLAVALGPTAANKNGALSTFIDVAAANLKGNGAALSASISNLSKAAGTLAGGRDDLFGTVKNLKKFTDALAASDTQVRHFQEQLAQVAGDLSDERSVLGAALHNLTVALHAVATFVKDNASKVHTDIVGLKDITNILVKDQAAINEALAVGPIALSNLAHGYQERTGTLGTRSNLANLTDPSLFPSQICDLLVAAGSTALGQLLLGDLLGNVTSSCSKLTGARSPGLSGLTNALTGSTSSGGSGG
jgi:phospholipid/cholesterol/gamma-HCH transport system substrate-binding protein